MRTYLASLLNNVVNPRRRVFRYSEMRQLGCLLLLLLCTVILFFNLIFTFDLLEKSRGPRRRPVPPPGTCRHFFLITQRVRHLFPLPVDFRRILLLQALTLSESQLLPKKKPVPVRVCTLGRRYSRSRHLVVTISTR